MKRILIVLLAVAIILTMPLTIYANGSTSNVYTFDGITIKFSETSSFTIEEQAAIAELIATGAEDSSATTYNVLCTLFGHKTTTESFTTIEHCVSDTAPRCLESLVDVTACSRCDYVYTDVYSSYYINCCD